MADDEDDDKQHPIYDDEEPEGGIFRWMSAAVVLLAVAGFFGLAWYAYKNGGDTVDEKDVELVQADKDPVKQAPVNPGGMQIPNQDKTVYGLISGKQDKPVAEHILAAPEEPVTRNDTQTWMSDSVKNKSGSGETPAAPATDVMKPDATKEQFNPKLRTTHADGTPMTVADATPAAAPAPKAAATPAPTPAPVVVTAPSPAPAPALAPAPKKAPPAAAADDSDDSDSSDTAKPAAAKPADKASATPPSGTRVQLGSYKSQSEAEGDWAKISKKFSDDIGGKQHYIVRADLGTKGIYYRLQLAPFASPHEAEQFCLDFVSSGQNCIPARGK